MIQSEVIKECCVTAQSIQDETTLIAWIVSSLEPPPQPDLQTCLSTCLRSFLPEYMLPSIYMILDSLPRSLNGKVDRSRLIYHETASEDSSECSVLKYNDEWEERFAALFQRILHLSPDSVKSDDNFFRLGGNSLKLMQLQVAAFKEFSLSLPYSALFANPTPGLLAGLVRRKKDQEESLIPPAKPQKAYPLSPSMRQMWLLWRTGQDEGRYTVSIKCTFTGEIDSAKATSAFQELVKRNSILRSYFTEQSGEVLQMIKDDMAVILVDSPRRQFDLSAAPLFDITLRSGELIFTTHHILADAAGLRILMEDFWTLYKGGVPAVSAQVHDITLWQLNRWITGDELFWQKMFSDGVTALSLPHLGDRPAKLDSSAIHTVFFDEKEQKQLSEYAALHNATLFQLFLAAYGFMLARLSHQERVIIGVPFSGRNHPHMSRTIGMFVKTLPLTLDISGQDFKSFLDHTCAHFAALWEHQEMTLEHLAHLIKPARLSSGKLFYDVMINYIPLPQPLSFVPDLHPQIVRGEYPGGLFDLVLDLREEEDGILAVFTYADQLFSQAMLEHWGKAFKELLLTGEWKMDHVILNPPVYTESANAQPELSDPLMLAELMEVWKEVLEKNEVSPTDDFFLSGGTSLGAIRIEAAMFERGWLLSATDIFHHPKLADMAGCLTPADDIDWEDY